MSLCNAGVSVLRNVENEEIGVLIGFQCYWQHFYVLHVTVLRMISYVKTGEGREQLIYAYGKYDSKWTYLFSV